MAKSLKKTIAVLLSVLMIAFSMPFTALAEVDDYVDVELMFHAINMTEDAGQWCVYDDYESSSKNDNLVFTGPTDVPLVYNHTTGTLTLKQSMAADYLDANEIGIDDTTLADGDYQLKTDDYVLVTVVAKNISQLYDISLAIKPSSNLIPAGLTEWTTGSSSKKRFHHELTTDPDAENISWFGYYNGYSGESAYGLDTEMNEFNGNGDMFLALGNATAEDITSYDEDGGLLDPETGEAGYTYPNTVILGSFLFKITDNNPVTFSVADEDSTVYELNANGLYHVDDAHTALEDAWTYSENQETAGAPGEGKFHYFDDWANTPAETKYTVTYVNAEGETISTEEVVENGSPASIPALPENTAHDTYSWDVDPNGAVITAATTFTQVKTTSDHTYGEPTWAWDATYENATATFTCSTCGDEQVVNATVESAYTDHTQNAKGYTTYTATAEFGGETYTDVQTVEDAEFNHNYAVSATTPATCTEDGSVTYTCSICGATYTEVGDSATGHAWGAATFAWTGYTAATATRVCANDASHVETVDAVITSETTPATPLEDGATVYTATATFEDGTIATDTQTEVIPATGYTYTFDHFDWAADYSTATAVLVANEDASVTKTATATVTSAYTAHTQDAKGYTTYTATYEGNTEDKVVEDEDFAHEWSEYVYNDDATCTEDGTKTATCSICGAEDTVTAENTATGHNYGAPVWAWDGTAATATFTCANNASHVEVVDATVEDVYTAHTQDAKGYTTYTATVAFEGNTYTDEKVVEDAEFAHEYAVSATTPATCTEDGTVTYTCSICGDSYTEPGDPATGHAWGEATFAWTGYTAATATRVCANDASHVETVDAVITSETTPATATADGKTVYTATATFEDGTIATDEQTEVIPATGYTYRFDHFDWAADYSTATAVLVANEDASVTTTAAATVTSAYTAHTQEAKGYTTYTASYVYDGETYTEDQVAEDAEFAHDYAVETTPATCTEDGTVTYTCSICGDSYTEAGDPATGHAWGEATFAWTGYTAATATRVCANDASHVETVDAVITSETTPATPLEDGATVYTATATFEDGTIATDEQTEVIPATGYTYTFDRFDWAADYSTAKAIYVADQDATVTKEYDAEVTSAYTAHTKTAKGYTTYTASYEDKEESKTVEDEDFAHEWSEWTESEAAVAPTRETAGKTAVETRTCSICGETETRGGEEVPALAGILVKAVDYANGTVEFKTAGTEYEGGMLYAYGTEYSVKATPAEGYKFAGWKIKNKLISETKETYSNVAFADMELTPVFVPSSGDEITVIFRDKSGNVISTVTKAKGEIADSDIPEAPAYPGMKFASWTINDADVTNDDIKALEASAQVWAKYEKDEAATGYKVAVTDENATIAPANLDTDNVPYNTKVTVSAEGASAWMVDGVVVAYGDSYEFYVGNDITLTPVYDEVDETPTVTIIGHNHIAGTKKQVILATESTPEGYTLKDRGFVYGRAANFGAIATKADAETANLIDNLPTGTRRSSGIGNTSEQYSITVSAAPGVAIRAFAYIVVQNDATKETSVIYSDVIDFAAE